ncbi:hypothetical protein [Aminobacter sp. MSH1]|uniref:hypothetical protein n=1 Tax=Aminobacter sp. MSH1 TaxID=374606 RepID=UPI000D339BC1|nr:hypothetical protein [Aminobacter sp. MSH1]
MVAPDPYSYPPRGLSREGAARYIGVGATKFDRLVTDGRTSKPKRIDERVLWDGLLVDSAFTDLPDAGSVNFSKAPYT